MLSAFRAGVIVGIERAAGTSFAFCRISIVGGDEFLARSALFDCHQGNDNTRQQIGSTVTSRGKVKV